MNDTTTQPQRRQSDALFKIQHASGKVLFALRVSESCEQIDTACQVDIETALTTAHADLEDAERIMREGGAH